MGHNQKEKPSMASYTVESIFSQEYTTSETEPGKINGDLTSPFMRLKPPTNTYTIDPSLTNVLEVKNSQTTIEIPANSFVFKDGKQVKDTVHITYEEFHTVADLLIGGITARYEDGKNQGLLGMAGTFFLAAEHPDSVIYLKKESHVKVDMASYTYGNYDTYIFDYETNNWTRMKAHKVHNNKTYDSLKGEWNAFLQQTEPPIYPMLASANDFLIPSNIKIPTDSFPEFAAYPSVKWILGDESQEAARKAFSQKWDSILVERIDKKDATYYITLGNADYEFFIHPVLNEQDYTKALKIWKDWEMNIDYFEIRGKVLKAQLKKEPPVIRTIETESFGHISCANPVSFRKQTGSFSFTVDNMDVLDRVYLILYETQAIARYTVNEWNELVYYPDRQLKVVACLSDETLATLAGHTAFNNLSEHSDSSTIVVNLEKQPQKIESRHTLNAILGL